MCQIDLLTAKIRELECQCGPKGTGLVDFKHLISYNIVYIFCSAKELLAYLVLCAAL